MEYWNGGMMGQWGIWAFPPASCCSSMHASPTRGGQEGGFFAICGFLVAHFEHMLII